LERCEVPIEFRFMFIFNGNIALHLSSLFFKMLSVQERLFLAFFLGEIVSAEILLLRGGSASEQVLSGVLLGHKVTPEKRDRKWSGLP
jgi:hypothetical protein